MRTVKLVHRDNPDHHRVTGEDTARELIESGQWIDADEEPTETARTEPTASDTDPESAERASDTD